MAFAELSEADAPAEIKAIYRDYARLSGVAMPALIIRHLATYPGLISEVWLAIGPLLKSGRLQETAWRVAAGVAPPGGDLTGPLPPLARDLARAYNRANPVNLLTAQTLLAGPETEAAPPPVPTAPWSPPEPVGDLPPPTPSADLTPEMLDPIHEMGFPGPAIPTLFRQLTDAPDVLRALSAAISPDVQNGAFDAAASDLGDTMAVEAAALARLAKPVPLLPETQNAMAALREFTGGLIPKMILIGRLLAASAASR